MTSMNAIVIDDQVNVVDGIVSGVHWEALGIGQVFKAYNSSQAQEVFQAQSISLMVCDIEMPMGSGIDLLKWVRIHYPKVECIFLTAHAKFEYANEALRLGCFDYVLQPVKYAELEQVLARAIAKSKQNENLDTLTQYGKRYAENARDYVGSLYRDILNGGQRAVEIFFQDQSVGEDGFTPETIYVPMLVSIIRRKMLLTQGAGEIEEEAMAGPVEEAFGQGALPTQVLKLEPNRFLVLFAWQAGASPDLEVLGEQGRTFLILCQECLGSTVACYLLGAGDIRGLPGLYRALLELEADNVTMRSAVFQGPRAEEWEKTQTLNWSRFGQLLSSRHSDVVLEELRQALNTLAQEEKLGYAQLFRFQQEFLGMVYQVNGKLGIRSAELFSAGEGYRLYNESLGSVEGMLAFVGFLLGAVDNCIPREEGELSLVERVKAYVEENISREITRNEIAGHVFLNPEYLSKIFKREMNIGLTDYILEEKMKLAKSYLSRSALPVSIIASKLGYSNFSYFSKVFKKSTGLSPNDYRREAQSHTGG